MDKIKALLAAVFASILLSVGGATACGNDSKPPTCSQDEVPEHDKDGWECEPDRNRNGIDDEDEGIGVKDDGASHKKPKKSKSPKPKKPRSSVVPQAPKSVAPQAPRSVAPAPKQVAPKPPQAPKPAAPRSK